MSQAINLNQFRKAKQAAQKKTEAAENTVKFGRPKTQKKAEQNAQSGLDAHLEGHKKRSMSLKPKKRSLTLRGHRTSVSLEDRFWTAFRQIAADENLAINALAAKVDEERPFEEGLASAIRDYVLQYYMRLSRHNDN